MMQGLPWYYNEIPQYYLCSTLIGVTLGLIFGWGSVPFFVLQAIMAVLLFEAVSNSSDHIFTQLCVRSISWSTMPSSELKCPLASTSQSSHDTPGTHLAA